MTDNFEDRLRQSLQARAADVTPDPAMYREVQSRIRHGRVLRWSLAGAGAVAMVAVMALVVPSVLDRRIEFEPAPVTTQPPTEEHSSEQTAAPPCAGEALVAVVARDGDLHAICSSGAMQDLPATDTGGAEDAPALSPDGALLAYEATHGHTAEVVVFDLPAGEAVERIQGGSSPAFSAVGHLAYVRLGDQGDPPRLFVREPIGTVEEESSMGGGPEDMPYGFNVRHLSWQASPTPRTLYWEARHEGTTVWGDDYVEPDPWRFSVDDDGTYAAPSSRDEGQLHVIRTCCVEVEGDAPQRAELGRVTLTIGSDGAFEPIATLPGDFDAAGMLTLAAAGTADVDPATGGWTSGGVPAWLVGDGDRLYLVDDQGNTDLVAEGVTGVAFNPAADLPPSADAAPSPSAAAQVEVHFVTQGGECGDDVVAFPRPVQGAGVLRGALEHLLAGPTPEDIAAGASPDSGFSAATAGLLNDVSVAENGVARIDFSVELAEQFSSASCAVGALFAQLDPTVRQFPSVKEVVYSFGGDIDQFYEYYQSAAPPHRPGIPLPVTRMQAKIRDAVVSAGGGNWDPLARLIDRETFSCSFSDQNEDCIALWQQQQAQGHDPLGPLAEILRGEPAKVDGAPIWAWPTEFVETDEYLGPRTGIQRNGTWRYYQQGGD